MPGWENSDSNCFSDVRDVVGWGKYGALEPEILMSGIFAEEVNLS
jgi:hypothetical protein